MEVQEGIEDAVLVEEIPGPVETLPPQERVDLVLLGVNIGTYTGWGNGNDTTLLFHNYESTIGLPNGLLGYDSLAGEFRYYNEAGEPTAAYSVVKTLNQIITANETPVQNEDAVVVSDVQTNSEERIVAAAIQWDGVAYSLPRPARHGQVLHSLHSVLDENQLAYASQGFITSDGRFVNRVQALQIAHRAKQIIRKTGGDRDLYSEDVW